MIDFRLTDTMNPKNAAQVVDHLRQPRLWIPTEKDYPMHAAWVEKTEAELVSGSRHALLAKFGRAVAGAIVFRPEPDEPTTVDIRNISINPDFRGRHVAAFTLRNAEFVAREHYPETSQYTVDTKLTNHEMLAFLESQGYTPVEIVDLYSSGTPDVVLSKNYTTSICRRRPSTVRRPFHSLMSG